MNSKKLARASVRTSNGHHGPAGAFWLNLLHWRASQVFSVSKDFFTWKTGFRATASIKQQRWLTILANPTMVCYYRPYCLDLPVVLIDCHMEGYASRLHHVCQGVGVAMHEIDLDGAERNICHNCVDELRMGGNTDKFNKVVHSTM